MALWNCTITWPNGTRNTGPVVATTADEAIALYAYRHHMGKDASKVTMTVEPANDPDGRTEALLLEGYGRAR